MSRIVLLSVVVLLFAGVAVSGELGWIDKNCDMCKNLTSTPGLFDSVKWEQHDISNGIVSMTTVNADFLKAYRTAHEGMVKTAERLMAGEKLHLCGSCTALGNCIMKGTHQEYVQTSNGDVTIFTSDKPELVGELQAWAKRNAEEQAKMAAHKG